MLLELWPFAISGHLMLLLYCAKHSIMYANVLKFHIWIPHEKIGDRIFFSYPNYLPFKSYFTFIKYIEISYICTVLTVMGKQCWSQAVLESGSWGNSVLQTPALVFLFVFFLVFSPLFHCIYKSLYNKSIPLHCI